MCGSCSISCISRLCESSLCFLDYGCTSSWTWTCTSVMCYLPARGSLPVTLIASNGSCVLLFPCKEFCSIMVTLTKWNRILHRGRYYRHRLLTMAILLQGPRCFPLTARSRGHGAACGWRVWDPIDMPLTADVVEILRMSLRRDEQKILVHTMSLGALRHTLTAVASHPCTSPCGPHRAAPAGSLGPAL